MLSLNTKHKRVIDEHVLFIKSCGFNIRERKLHEKHDNEYYKKGIC